jgi:predicted AAA+ superfamily ATPase
VFIPAYFHFRFIFTGILIANINRTANIVLKQHLDNYPCVAIVGPRQVGKTTTAKALQKIADKDCIYLDLESDEDIQKLANAEQYFNARQDKLIILDEVQRDLRLFPLLRSVIDKNRVNGRFIVLGSASPELLTNSSESLAGRIAYIEMHPLTYPEVKPDYSFANLWLKGGFPSFFLQENLEVSFEMRLQFIQTYIERELPLLGLSVSPMVLKNLMRIIAHTQGQTANYSAYASSLGVSINTIKRYLDYFENAFLIRRIESYHPNTKKRIVKAPKIYIRDTGVLHTLFNVETVEDLDGFVGKGSSWESFVIQQVIALLKPTVTPCFYRTQDGTELDLVLIKGMKPVLGLEIKVSNAPKITKGTTIASRDLENLPVYVVTHSTTEDYSYNESITITSFERLLFHLYKMNLITTA